MNSEQAFSLSGLSNPFDALYRTVFKYAPSQYFGGVRPYGKYAYNNAIVDAPEGGYDSWLEGGNVFQTAMPGGKATANRVGPVGSLEGSFLDKGITVGVKAAALNAIDTIKFNYEMVKLDDDGIPIEIVPVGGEYKASFLDFAGGASVDIAKFAHAVGPSLTISGSYGIYNSTNGKVIQEPGNSIVSGDAATESASNMISLGLNYNFFTRFSFLAGYQLLTTNYKATIRNVDGTVNDSNNDIIFDNLAVGFKYEVADGGNLTVKFSRLSAKFEPKDAGGIVIEGASVGYRTVQPEVYLTVKF
jgi:hypothetical protein